MKKYNKLCSIVIMLIGIVISINAIGQTTNYVPKWNGLAYGNTVTPVYEDATNLRIGIGTITPAYKLDVNGDLNIASTNAYRIATNPVLWNNNHTADIFVGVGAGNSTMTGHSNTLMGNNAGTSLTSGGANTFIGVQAGTSAEATDSSVAIGYQALYSNQNLLFNTAVGFQALYTNNSCGDCFNGTYATNTAMGYQALYTSQAYGGCAFGFQAAYSSTTGCSNVAMGENTLKYTTTGGYNVAVGASAAAYNVTGRWNTCVGDHAGGGSSGYSFSNNSLFGYKAGASLLTDSDNVLIGAESGYNNTYASENTAVGYKSLYSQSYGSSSWNSYNTAIGDSALYSNQPTSTSNGIDNTALGHSALNANTTGMDNTASGYQAGYYNQGGNYNAIYGYQAGYGASSESNSGNSYFGYWAGYATQTNNSNVCIGIEAGQDNTSSYETFVGSDAGQLNTSGLYNTFVGYGGGGSNKTGDSSTFVGSDAGFKNTIGHANSGLGIRVLFSDTSGSLNTAIGTDAGYSVITGDSDVFVGAFANVSSTGSAFNNCAAYGYGASALANDKFYFGNANVTGCYNLSGNWLTGSDGRFKINVKNENIGLDFINKLRPVTYNMDTKALDAFINPNKLQQATQQTDSTGNTSTTPAPNYSASTSIVHSGFIAQEVDSVAKACSFSCSIVSEPANSGDIYALNYSEFVVPLVKAVQQLDSMNKGLAARMQTQDSIINGLQNQISQCCSQASSQERNSIINNNNDSPVSTQQLELGSLTNSIILYQNEPNPFGDNTVIRYFVPENIANVVIVFYDEFGREINRSQVQQNGYGRLEISTSNLSNGIYSYSIMSDGKVIDTKRMLRAK